MLEDDDQVSTYAIPSPDYSSIRITDVHYSTAEPKKGAAVIDNTIILLGGFVWELYSGTLINVLTKSEISKALLGGALDVVSNKVSISFSSKVSEKSYQTSYMYKTWSDYYDCYLIYFCLFDYSDAARTKIRSVYHEQIATSSIKVGL